MKQDIKKVSSFSEVCESALLHCVTPNLVAGIIANIILGATIIPLMYATANESFVMNDVDKGLRYIIAWNFIKIVFTVLNNVIIEPIRRRFNVDLELYCEKMINDEIEILSMRSIRNVFKRGSGYEKKMNIAKYRVSGFVSSFMYTFMSMFTFFGYAYWVFSISYKSAIVYIIATIGVSFFIKKKEKKIEENMELYDKYWNNQGNISHEGFHDDIKKPFDGMYQATVEIEETRSNRRKEDKKITNMIDILFGLVFIFNCYFVVNDMDIIYLITYVQYCSMLHSSVSSCFMVYEQYKDSKREYNKYEEMINELPKRNIVEQYTDQFDGIIVNKIGYVYSGDVGKIPFGLQIVDILVFFKKDIILVDGSSGNGKSTLFDIIGGVTSDKEYDSDIEITLGSKQKKINGFECLTKRRFYTEQSVSIPCRATIAQIVSGIFDGTITKEDEKVIRSSLIICCCDDFVDIHGEDDFVVIDTVETNIENPRTESRKSIHEKKVTMSGGQEGRIILSRMMYGIITKKPAFILLDEVDKSVQEDMMVLIMNRIFDYAVKHDIITFVIAHSNEVKRIERYTQKITLENGRIV